ncbi:hypothetical protein AAGS40_12155 [Paraburkholderia sp. PREW-6R]|uniref:hypothetical protein n=1 Tax=Paraburkholderia sp. PREW-6R TaxID=3141544 RepID=UPI0031F53E70
MSVTDTVAAASAAVRNVIRKTSFHEVAKRKAKNEKPLNLAGQRLFLQPAAHQGLRGSAPVSFVSPDFAAIFGYPDYEDSSLSEWSRLVLQTVSIEHAVFGRGQVDGEDPARIARQRR